MELKFIVTYFQMLPICCIINISLYSLGMAIFLRNVSFMGILLDALFEHNTREWQEVSDLVTQGMATGVVKPLKTTVFSKNEVEDAFRFMAQGKHIGKVLIQVSRSVCVFAELSKWRGCKFCLL